MAIRETLRHKEAFEFYYKLGKERSYTKVAQQFNVSRTTAAKWAKRYDWQSRIIVRDGEIGKVVERQNIESIVEEKTAMLKMLKAQVAKIIQKDEHGLPFVAITINDQKELLSTFDTMLKLMGEGEGGLGGNVVVQINSNIPRPGDKVSGKKRGKG